MSKEILKRRRLYEDCKRRALRAADADSALAWLYAAASAGAIFPFGQLSDPELEKAVEAIAASLPRPDLGATLGGTAYLTSVIIDHGGHTELMLSWLPVTSPPQTVISSEWQDSNEVGITKIAMVRSFADVHLCPQDLTPLNKVKWISEKLAAARPAKAILYMHPGDVISMCAAMAYRIWSSAKIYFCDLSEHTFNVGAYSADHVIESRPAGVTLAANYRGVPPEKISLVPLTARARPASRDTAEVPEGLSCSLTVSSMYKLLPDGSWHFGWVIGELLRSEPNHCHVVVGDFEENEREKLLREVPDDVRTRLLWTGPVSNIEPYLRRADFMIDSFPFTGGIVKLEAMRTGLPMVAIANEPLSVVGDTGALPEDYKFVARSNEEVLSMSRSLVGDAKLRQVLGDMLKASFEQRFSEPAVRAALEEALGPNPRGQGPVPPVALPDAEYMTRITQSAIPADEWFNFISATLGYEPQSSPVSRLARRAMNSARYRAGKAAGLLLRSRI